MPTTHPPYAVGQRVALLYVDWRTGVRSAVATVSAIQAHAVVDPHRDDRWLITAETPLGPRPYFVDDRGEAEDVSPTTALEQTTPSGPCWWTATDDDQARGPRREGNPSAPRAIYRSAEHGCYFLADHPYGWRRASATEIARPPPPHQDCLDAPARLTALHRPVAQQEPRATGRPGAQGARPHPPGGPDPDHPRADLRQDPEQGQGAGALAALVDDVVDHP